MTVGELEARMSSRELTEWMAFDQVREELRGRTPAMREEPREAGRLSELFPHRVRR